MGLEIAADRTPESSQSARDISALAPIVTELARLHELTRSANRVLTHRSKPSARLQRALSQQALEPAYVEFA